MSQSEENGMISCKMAATVTGKSKEFSKQHVNQEKGIVSKNAVDQNQTKFGPLPSFPLQKVWARSVIVIAAAVIVYFSAKNNKETVFASQKELLEKRAQHFPCSNSYKSELSRFQACVPQRCGRLVTDTLVTSKEAETLLELAKNGLALGGSDGGASILDLHSGALSHGQEFVNFYKIPESLNAFKPEQFMTYNVVKKKIHQAVSYHFGIRADSLYLTQPTFFSRLTNTPPKTTHDEYWHTHVDKETYSSFHYTSLLYLNDYSRDFFGGRFVFVEPKNRTTVVEPKKGRVSAFTSGAENPHYVEQVTSGTRYAITVSFTCDPTKAIADPQFRRPQG